MRMVTRNGHSLGLIIIRIKGPAIVMVTVEVFPVDAIGEVTHHVMVGIN